MRKLILSWINQSGPFWEEAREAVDDDYFEFSGQDVTEQGLGEAARRNSKGLRADAFGFPGSQYDCDRTPLVVQHGLTEAPIAHIPVHNYFSTLALAEAAIAATPLPSSWPQLIAQCKVDFGAITIDDGISAKLAPYPFSASVARRVKELLKVLDEYALSRDEQGRNTARTIEIIENHFSGDNAWFSDESDGNKIKFKNDLTFMTQPGGEKIFCPFHGKIKTQQYRIHFEWPLRQQGGTVRIMYIGPKITKD